MKDDLGWAYVLWHIEHQRARDPITRIDQAAQQCRRAADHCSPDLGGVQAAVESQLLVSGSEVTRLPTDVGDRQADDAELPLRIPAEETLPAYVLLATPHRVDHE